jgi:hypothetical protein
VIEGTSVHLRFEGERRVNDVSVFLLEAERLSDFTSTLRSFCYFTEEAVKWMVTHTHAHSIVRGQDRRVDRKRRI